MVPSVDRVGRYFPLTLVAELPAGTSILSAAAADAGPFFDARGAAGHRDAGSRAGRSRDLRRRGHCSWRDELGSGGIAPRVALDPHRGADPGRPCPGVAGRCRSARRRSWRPAFEQLLSQRLSVVYDPLVLWWTAGSSIVEPSCLIARGLPHPDTFAALLDGSWAQRQWRSIPAHVETERDCRHARRRRGAAALPVGGGDRCRPGAHHQPGRVRRARRRSGCGPSPTGWAGTATARSRAAWCATRWPTSCPDGELRGDDRGARASGCARSTSTSIRVAGRSVRRRPQRQHRRGAPDARQPLRRPVGRRQPRLPLARRAVEPADARPQPGGARRGPRARTRTRSRGRSAASRR